MLLKRGLHMYLVAEISSQKSEITKISYTATARVGPLDVLSAYTGSYKIECTTGHH